MVQPRPPEAQKVAALREALPATGAGIYLDTATHGPLPAETAAAMREADEWELRVGRATAGRDEDVLQRSEEARAVLAALVGGQPHEMALMPGLEVALAVAAWAPDWQRGDRILTTSGTDPRVGAALAGVAGRLALEIDVAVLPEGGGADELVGAMEALTTERTRLVAVSHVLPGAGLQVPLPQLAELAHRRGAWLAVDASASAGAIPMAAPETGADLICFSTDAWCLGPEGTAALWAGPRALAEARTAIGPATDGPAGEARRLEPGTLPRTTLLGLARSVGWLEMYVGLEWALERTGRLVEQAYAALAAVPGVELLTPAASRAAIVTFRVAGWSETEVLEELRRRVFAIMLPLPESNALRASLAWFNTEEEIDRLAQAVAVISGHTPDTLPRRPSLLVLPDAGGAE
jgi:cysteine desulfurase / selenocysteine lyase